MRVRPLINCLMSEIETFLCFLTTGLIFTVLIIIECTSGFFLFFFYIRIRIVIICFLYIIRFGLFRVFSYGHLYDSGYLFLRISFIISGYPYMYIC